MIHFDQPLKHAKHYVGFTRNYSERMRHHRGGTGANILRVLKDQNIGWMVARVWEDGRDREQRMKKHMSAKQQCPICNESLVVRMFEQKPYVTHRTVKGDKHRIATGGLPERLEAILELEKGRV